MMFGSTISEATMTKYFTYNGDTLLFSGVVEVESDDDAPLNSTIWDPRPIPSGKVALWLDGAWDHVTDYTTNEGLAEYSSRVKASVQSLSLKSQYSPFEQSTFSLQEQWSKTYLEDGTLDPGFVQLAETRGENVEELARKIRAKSTENRNQVTRFLVEIQGIRRLMDEAVSYEDWKTIQEMADNLKQ